ncbi:MAG: S-layer homology domain-containing protein, partial [Syntrophomonadaceae bacterium]|nr:S-layer homology domain-containing protein [Syntrophomonadaceae bacterium]
TANTSQTAVADKITYYFRVKQAGEVPPSEYITFSITRPDPPADAPEVTNKTDTTITVTAIDGQEYAIKKASENNYTSWKTGTDGSATFTGLTGGTPYTIVTRVKHVAAPGSEAFASVNSPETPDTTKLKPSISLKPNVTDFGVNTITIKAPVDNGYEYRLVEDGAAVVDEWTDLAKNVSHTFTELKDATKYTVEMRMAETGATMSSNTTSKVVWTLAAPPAANEGYTPDFGAETIAIPAKYEGRKVTAPESVWTTGPATLTLDPGASYEIRKVESQSGNVPASAPTSFTVPERPPTPDAPAAPARDVVTDTSITIQTQPGCEYLLTESTTTPANTAWVTGPLFYKETGNVAGTKTFKNLTGGTEYYVHTRQSATGDAPASASSAGGPFSTKAAPATAPTGDSNIPSVPAAGSENAPTSDGITINTQDEQEYVIVPHGETPTDADWAKAKQPAEGETTLTFDNLEPGTAYDIYYRTPGTDTAMPSNAGKIENQYTLPAAPATTAYSINLDDDNITFDPDVYEVSTDPTFSDSTQALDSGDALTPGTTYYIRKKADGNVPAGAPASFTVSDQTFTVTYYTNGGSAVAPQTILVNKRLTESTTTTTRSGYNFVGWYKDGSFTTLWNFGTDRVTADVTLYAKWTAQPPRSVGGTINNATSATVELKKGDAVIKSLTTSSDDGAFNFENVPVGDYNLVVTADGKTVTTLVTIADGDVSGLSIAIPADYVSSIVEVEPGAPDVVAGGLDEEAEDVAAVVASGSTVVVTLTIESKPDAGDKIEAVAPGKTLTALEITVEKTVAGNATTITETANVLELIIPFPTSGRTGITVYREHNGAATVLDRLNARPTAPYTNGTFFVGDGFVVVYAKEFSTYAIGYTIPSGGSGGSGVSAGGGGAPAYAPTVPQPGNGSVTTAPANPQAGDSVTLTPKPDAGYEVDKITVTDKNGEDVPVTMNADGTYAFTQPAASVTISVTYKAIETSKNPFKDVAAGSWYYDDVMGAYEAGLMNGTADDMFSPAASTSRAMSIAILWRMENEPESDYAMIFEDVPAGEWYTEAIRWAAGVKIVEGYDAAAFGPDDDITREQLAAILWRYAKYKGYDVSVGEDTNILSYDDAFAISQYSIPAMQWACGAGLIQGDGENLMPQGSATRAQVAAILQRFCENVAE